MPEAPLHVHKRVLLEGETINDNETTAAKLQRVFGMQDDDAKDVVASLELV